MAVGITFLLGGGYYRIRSQQSGERLDRSKEGWPILIGIRLLGLVTMLSATAWLWVPAFFARASWPVPLWARWIGVGVFTCGVAWLLWMFQTLGRNLTDTVVVRKDAHFVNGGPYRYVRNPMYTGVLVVGVAFGVALGAWLIPVSATLLFLLLAVRTRREEKYLVERFGAEYREYMGRVGRFFPKSFGRRNVD